MGACRRWRMVFRGVFSTEVGKCSGRLRVLFGKTVNARRVIPLTARAKAVIEMRRATASADEWVFPAGTKSGHIEKSTLNKKHPKAAKLAGLVPFPLYTFRHTCLTRWAAYMDPYTLAYLAGHSEFSTTKRYVHPQAHTVREAMERARVGQGGHSSGHTSEMPAEGREPSIAGISMKPGKISGRGEWIRTTGLLVPNQAL
jgi:hypothetical protein